MDKDMEAISGVLERLAANSPSLSPSEIEEYEQKRLAQAAEDEKRERHLKGEALWSKSNVPYRHASFEPPKDGPWREAYETLKPKLGTGFLYVVMGNRGTGKTQIGTALIGTCCWWKLRSGMYVKALDIFIALREAYRKDGDAESQVIGRFVKPSLLVIDAMEERGETAFEDRLLNHIIDKRYDNMDDTLLITNQTPEAFATSAGPSIVSRIHETGDKIVCDWESFRKKAPEPPAGNWSPSVPVGDRA
jgi:DNA replication protein DnaC